MPNSGANFALVQPDSTSPRSSYRLARRLALVERLKGEAPDLEEADAVGRRTQARGARHASPPAIRSDIRYSYWSAARTFSFEARRAGRCAALTPAMTATATNATSVPPGTANAMP